MSKLADGRGRGAALLGLTRRTAILALVLIASLKFGKHAWMGVALGYLAGFAFMVRRRARLGFKGPSDVG